jgi:hypothetical protein
MTRLLLELFSGTRSVGCPWREAGHRVISVDIDGRHGADVCEDILTWDYKSLEGIPDVIWASPHRPELPPLPHDPPPAPWRGDV